MAITCFERTVRFQREFKKLDPQLQAKVKKALEGLLQNPFPKALRHHTLNGYCPTVHVVDVTPNHAYQITFNWLGEKAILLRVGTHRHIDENPE